MVDLNAMLGMDGKAAIVTGGASGIGFGVARFLAEMGASVALFDVDKTRGENSAESIRLAVHLDVDDAGIDHTVQVFERMAIR